MKEKVLELWLDNNTERYFQIPFAYYLLSHGYKVLHVTRHCGMELGKDILAINSDGILCAFQLKTVENSRFTLSKWREINSQMIDMVYLKISHSSIGSYQGEHFSYLVTNGNIEEEVTRAIEDFNKSSAEKGKPPLKTIEKWQILKWAIETHPSIFPTEIEDIKPVLRFILESGTSYLLKEELTSYLETCLSLHNPEMKDLKESEILRKIIGNALITSICLTEYSKKDNWIAQIEAWGMYLASIISFAERSDLEEKLWKPQYDLVKKTIYNLLVNLLQELKTKEYLIVGDPIADIFFYRARITYLVSLMSILGIWKKINKDEQDYEFIKDFVLKHIKELHLWGEGAIPQLLTFYWFYGIIDATPKSDMFLVSIINSITTSNKPKSKRLALAPSYYQCHESMLYINGLENIGKEDDFSGRSFFLEKLVHIIIRRNWKQMMKLLWPDVTHITFEEFTTEEKWQYFLWRSNKGVYKSEVPKKTEYWNNLKTKAFERNYSNLPNVITRDQLIIPIILLFINVYAHRSTDSIIKYIDDKFLDIY